MFDRIQPLDIKDINRISAGYHGLLFTGYHELSPLSYVSGWKFVTAMLLSEIIILGQNKVKGASFF